MNQLSGSVNRTALQKNIRVQLESDSYNVTKVEILSDHDGKLGIEIEANKS